MNEEIEVAWVRLADNSDLVLTSLYVFQHKDAGIFGESKAIIRREAVSMVRVGWQRSRTLLALGSLLLAVFLGLMVGSLIAGPADISLGQQATGPATEGAPPSTGIMSYVRDMIFFSAASLVQYGSLLGGIGILVLFWFYKRREVQIVGPGAMIGGVPKSYEEAQKFCDLLLSGVKEPPPAKKVAKEPKESKPAAESEWRL